MKTSFLFGIIFYLSSLGSNALGNHHSYGFSQIQSDTSMYLRNEIVSHKDKYQHQKLAVLLKELKFTVKSYTILTWSPSDKRPLIITLFFDDNKTISDKIASAKPKLICLDISFENEVTKKQASILFQKSMGKWEGEENEFYGNLIVKNIAVPQYQ